MPAMASRIPRSEAASIAQSTKAPAGWFTARRISRSAGGTTDANLPRGADKSSGIGQRADDLRSRGSVEWDDGRSGSRGALRGRGRPRQRRPAPARGRGGAGGGGGGGGVGGEEEKNLPFFFFPGGGGGGARRL